MIEFVFNNFSMHVRTQFIMSVRCKIYLALPRELKREIRLLLKTK